MDYDYDVIVVGAGPGGSQAARRSAELGMKTLLIDKRQEIGTPVRCGEGLGEYWMKIAGLEYDNTWCLQESHGAILISPKKKEYEIRIKDKGYVIERKVLEKKLAANAIRAGAKCRVKTRAIDVLKDGNRVCGVRVESPDGIEELHSKMVIAADGVDSKIAKYSGVNTVNPLVEVDSGYEYEMAGVEMEHHDMIYLFFGQDIAPRGYVWIFPKGKDLANVGIGIGGHSSKGEMHAKQYLDKFIHDNPKYFSKAGIIEVKGGSIPVGAPIKEPYSDGLLIIGDAAHMVNAIHGGGIGTSMEAGILAAQVAKEAIEANDFSKKFLSTFGKRWYAQRGDKLVEVLKARKFFEKLSDGDMETLGEMMRPEELLMLSSGSKFDLFLKVLKKSPKLAILAVRTLA